MATTYQQRTTTSWPAWQLGFGSLEAETEGELEVSGRWPEDISGRLYRIGPARNDVYGERYKHWFDGDGMVHAFDIAGERVSYRNRFVDTAKKRAEDAAGQRLFGGFGTAPTGNPIQKFRRGYGNSSNTNIVWHAGKLLALWEGGRPHRLDPETLNTLGEEDFDGALPIGRPFSAHPKYDPRTGELINFGMTYGRTARLDLYSVDRSGKLRSLPPVTLPAAALIHDFAVTASKIVVVVAPMVLPRIPLGLILKQSSFAQSL
ncbi:MAG: carotenoid oxygenase family protein, partial [Chloroflexota bacterium]